MSRIRKPQKMLELLELIRPYRYLLCVDLEATCNELPEGLSEEQAQSFPGLIPVAEMETIEVGAVVVDTWDDDAIVGEFCRFVKPTLHPQLTEFCIGLTTITQADVDQAQGYAEVSKELSDFIEPYRADGIMWGSWGAYDLKQLAQDAALHDCQAMLFDLQHTNLKKWHWKVLSCRAMGLKNAVLDLGLSWSGTHHRGIDDSRNVAAVFHQLRIEHNQLIA
ncbi:3'-5' exonuclease [Pseudomonas viridiflava]|uniref:3'-5' exonuclease n=1 Tax=Pseudomonas viridiflava TaxID=33069 RepID=UPI000F018B95|nr:3'-5' exonuclease [Pseudomonas viridiflava]MBD8615087.1 exonuclease domain-containing protein [Pseudomonas putida]